MKELLSINLREKSSLRPKAWKSWQTIFLLLSALALLFLTLDISLRFYYLIKYREEFLQKLGDKVRDPVLGWHGDKKFGDFSSKKPKIFFVGDSFTYRDPNHPERHRAMYYDVVGKNLEVEIFEYGGGGYGTLQEYLVIDKFIDEIKPDLVVLQVTSNDFLNNLWDLEKKSYIHNNYLVRPYLEKGRIIYRYPRGPFFLRKYLMPYSYLIYWCLSRIDLVLAKAADQGTLPTIEAEILAKGLRLDAFRRSVNVTSELVAMIKKRCRDTPVIAFPVFTHEPYFSQFKSIFRKQGIAFLEEIPKLAWRAEKGVDDSQKLIRDDSHWGPIGHRACGDYLSEYIRNNFGFGERKSRGLLS